MAELTKGLCGTTGLCGSGEDPITTNASDASANASEDNASEDNMIDDDVSDDSVASDAVTSDKLTAHNANEYSDNVTAQFFRQFDYCSDRGSGIHSKFYHNGRHMGRNRPSQVDRGRRNSLRRHRWDFYWNSHRDRG